MVVWGVKDVWFQSEGALWNIELEWVSLNLFIVANLVLKRLLNFNKNMYIFCVENPMLTAVKIYVSVETKFFYHDCPKDIPRLFDYFKCSFTVLSRIYDSGAKLVSFSQRKLCAQWWRGIRQFTAETKSNHNCLGRVWLHLQYQGPMVATRTQIL